MQYFFANGNEQKGPYSLDELAALGLRPDTLVWREGLAEWQPASAFPELATAPQHHAAPPVLTHPLSRTHASRPLDYQFAVRRPTDGFAIASLICGIVSLPGLCAWGVGFVPAILAIVFGFVARSRIKTRQTDGMGLAIAGLILGFIALLMLVIFGGFVALLYSARLGSAH